MKSSRVHGDGNIFWGLMLLCGIAMLLASIPWWNPEINTFWIALCLATNITATVISFAGLRQLK